MKIRTRSVASVVAAIAFCCANVTALALPKAAEDENAQVSSGDNAVRPKISSAKPQTTAIKKKPTAKSAKSLKPRTSPKQTKAKQAKKK